MVDFWLDDISSLISLNNFQFDGISESQKNVQMLNITALVALIVGVTLSFKKKKVMYFAGTVVIMALTIFIKSNTLSTFASVNNLDNAFDTGAQLTRNVNQKDNSGLNNKLYVTESMNFNKGDVIALSVNNKIIETAIISDIKYTIETDQPVLILLNNLVGNYSKNNTKILKVSDAAPGIIPPPDGNVSIQNAQNNGTSDPMEMATQNYPLYTLPNQNRFDWNLEQSSMIPGTDPTYVYQGQPYGNLKSRNSTITNPMGTINVTEYDAPPTFYGTSNVAETENGILNDTRMTENQEATLSQSVNDLLFHKGNSQMVFSPMPGDTLPNNQTAFANFCYNTPTNMVNVKYGSIFVNDPEKMKLVTRLTKASGTENGGGR